MGRHREFDVDRALDAALIVFWEKGYEGASYNDLCHATGVVRPGLYAAFGNKEAFFRRAVHRYEEKFLSFMHEALEAPVAREVVRRILEGSVEAQTCFAGSRGCMVVNGMMTCSEESAAIRVELINRRNAAEAALRARLERAREEGDLPPRADCAMLAGFVMSVTHGIAVQAKAGTPKDTLEAVARHVLATWPS